MNTVEVRLLEFDDLIQRYVESFVGRKWLVRQVDALLSNPTCRFVVLTGDPGVGKSAFMAHLAATHTSWPRYFIRRDNRNLLRPSDGKTFFLTIGGQLATLQPDIFTSEQLNIAVHQRIGQIESTGEVMGVRIAELKTSPFYAVAIQVEQEIQSVAGKATGVAIDRLVTEPRLLTLQDLQFLGLLEPAWVLYRKDPTARITVLVDALDELRFSPAETDILNALLQLPTGLTHQEESKMPTPIGKLPEIPPNLRFIITSRREKFLDKLLGRSDVRELKLDVAGEQSRKDLRTFIRANMPKKGLTTALSHVNKTIDSFEAELLARAAGNFLYLRSVLNAISEALEVPEKGERLHRLLRVEELPENLDTLYGYFLQSIVDWTKRSGFGETAWRTYLRPLLGILAVAQEPLSNAQLLNFTGLESEDLGDLLRELRQFVEPVDGQQAFRIYHTSFAEFLLDAQSNVDYRIDGIVWHTRIADYYSRSEGLDRDKLDLYCLNHLATHLYNGNKLDRLSSLVNEAWMHVRFRNAHHSYTGWMGDLELVWKATQQQDFPSGRSHVPMDYLGVQVRCAMSQATVRSLAQHTPPLLLAQLVAARCWDVQRAINLAGQVSDVAMRRRYLCALLRLELLNEQQRTDVRAMLHSYGEDLDCGSQGEDEAQIPGFPFILDSISEAGRARLEQLLEQTLTVPSPATVVLSRRENPLLDLLKDELTPGALGYHELVRQLGIRLSPHPVIAEKASTEASLALGLALGFTPSLASRHLVLATRRVLLLGDPRYRAAGLWALAPYVSEAEEDTILQAVDKLPAGELRLAVLDRLAAHLSRPGLTKTAALLSTVRGDETERMLLMAKFVHHLESNDLAQEAVSQALHLADSVGGDLATSVYADLAAFLSEKQIEIAVSRSRGLSYRNIRSLSQLLPYMPEAQQREYATEAVRKPLEYEMEGYHGPALIQLGHYLDINRLNGSLSYYGFTGHEKPDSVLRRVEMATSPEERADACMEPFLEITFKQQGKTFFDCLASLLPQMNSAHIPKASYLTVNLANMYTRTSAWIMLSTKLEANERADRLSIVTQDILSADDKDRAGLLGLLADHHPLWVLAQADRLKPVVIALLRRSALEGRASMLRCLHELLPALLLLGNNGLAETMYRSLLEICYEWEWL